MKKDGAMKDGDREVLIALDKHRAGKSMRGIAEDVLGVERAAAEWYADGGVRLRTRRVLQKARANAERGQRAVAAASTVGYRDGRQALTARAGTLSRRSRICAANALAACYDLTCRRGFPRLG